MEHSMMVLVDFIWSLSIYELLFLLFCLNRWPRLIVNTIAHWLYRSIPKPSSPTLSNEDVTVIVPTIENDVEQLRGPLLSILACAPYQLILSTTVDRYDKLVKFTDSLNDSRLKVYHSRIANKRLQLREALPRVQTMVTVLVDDDVTWPKTVIPWLLAPLENPRIGSVGVCQRVKRLRTGPLIPRMFNWLGADYIERRNFEISATHYMDGGTSCMSGRTNALRTEILQDPLFLDGFCKERWGRFHLNADDDNFVTRWLVNHGWLTWIQYNPECEIETTLENNVSFLWQCLRWARSNWRSNYTTLFVDRVVWTRQPWSVYAIYLGTFLSLGMVSDPLFFFLFAQASKEWTPNARHWGWVAVLLWYLLSKTVKRIGLLKRRPTDVIFIPLSIFFGFGHGLIKITALCTWNVTSWGNRPDGDINNDERMSPQILPAEVMTNPSYKSRGLVRYATEFADEKVQQADEQDEASAPGKSANDAVNNNGSVSNPD